MKNERKGTRLLTLLLVSLYGISGSAFAQTIAFSVSAVSFGSTQIGYATSIGQTVTVTNTGGATATGVTFSITGGNPGDFSEGPTGSFANLVQVGFVNPGATVQVGPAANCGGSLPAGQSCKVNISFYPLAAGARWSTFQAAGSNFGTQTLVLTGYGVSSGSSSGSLQSDTVTGTLANSLVALTTSNCPGGFSVCGTTPSTSTTSGIIGIVTAARERTLRPRFSGLEL